MKRDYSPKRVFRLIIMFASFAASYIVIPILTGYSVVAIVLISIVLCGFLWILFLHKKFDSVEEYISAPRFRKVSSALHKIHDMVLSANPNINSAMMKTPTDFLVPAYFYVFFNENDSEYTSDIYMLFHVKAMPFSNNIDIIVHDYSVFEVFKDRLKNYKIDNMSITIPATEPFDYDLIRDIVNYEISKIMEWALQDYSNEEPTNIINQYCVGECQFCVGQGLLTFYTEKQSGSVYIACDECFVAFDTPVEAIEFYNIDKTDYGLSRYSTLEEIQDVKWEGYIYYDAIS